MLSTRPDTRFSTRAFDRSRRYTLSSMAHKSKVVQDKSFPSPTSDRGLGFAISTDGGSELL